MASIDLLISPFHLPALPSHQQRQENVALVAPGRAALPNFARNWCGFLRNAKDPYSKRSVRVYYIYKNVFDIATHTYPHINIHRTLKHNTNSGVSKRE